MAMAARTVPALAYRGCISVGQFEISDRFVLGPAVDEAATYLDAAQAAIVWMAPTANDLFGKSEYRKPTSDDYRRSYVAYDVPLKGGDRYNTFAVSPFSYAPTFDERAQIARSILGTFPTGKAPLDVAIKRQNTDRFLAHCIETCSVTT